MTLTAERLRDVRTIGDVLKLLADDLDWPIGAHDLESATYDYSPDELGIPADQVPQLLSLRQLRPLTANQPWGIFFLEFSGPRLPLTPLRRLLQRLVAAKRAESRQHPTWSLTDLLFVITTEQVDSVELHFVAFSEDSGHVAEVRSLPWRPEQSPHRHLARLAGELLPHLGWPADPSDTDAWRRAWRAAFVLRHGEAIRSAEHLAERMAAVARALRTEFASQLEADGAAGPLRTLLAEVRRELVGDLDEQRFADMCAQTLVYGTLSARVTDPVAFGASPTLAVIPLSNRFLAAFFEQIHDHALTLDMEDAGLEQLVADLRASNVEAVLDQFGSTAKGGDPVIHFYEEFLKRYDPRMRADAGAFYTPQPVVHFMVRAVDSVLRATFGLEGGLSDESSWGVVARYVGADVPAGIDPDSPFLSVIDPATGTGTFLVEWIRRARESFLEHQTKPEWQAHLREFVLPSLHAFELMLGPYAIAHLKVALETYDEGAAAAALAIHVTDTLEQPAPQAAFETMTNPIALEGEHAAALKQDARFTVCIGNPPYDREQRADVLPGGKRKGGVVRYGVAGVHPLIGDLIEPMKRAGLGKHVKNLYNDYVYFWRWATWQTTQRVAGPGVVAFITASSYLDGVSMGGLRAHLRSVFDELWIVDLGGDSRGARPEENVFEIRTPVAVCIGVRTVGGTVCRVQYSRVHGTRAEKFGWLSQARLNTIDWTAVSGVDLDSFVPRTGADYWSWSAITEVFPWIHSGCQFKRTWPIGPGQSLLKRRWDALAEMKGVELRDAFHETRDRKVASRVSYLADPDLRLTPLNRATGYEQITRYGYRSFDRQWAIADNRVADFPRQSLWRSAGPSQLFMTTLTSTKLGRGPVVTATPYVPDLDHFRGSYGARNVMPLYRDAGATEMNIASGLAEALSAALHRPIDPVEIVAYVYGLTATSAYADLFRDELGEEAGPVRIPFTADARLFDRVVRLGRDLLWWHTWGERFQPPHHADLPPGRTRELEPVRGYPDSFSYDAGSSVLTVGSGAFGPVSGEAWEFEVSGLKVLRSWLAYRMTNRKGRKSSPLDDIRPVRWTFTPELLLVISMLQHTIEVTPRAGELLAAVVAGPLVDPSSLPAPTDAERKPPGD